MAEAPPRRTTQPSFGSHQTAYRLDDLGDAHPRGVYLQRVLGLAQRRERPAGVVGVTGGDVGHQFVERLVDSLGKQLLPAAPGPFFDGSDEEHLDLGVGEDHRSGVPTFQDDVAPSGLLPLSGRQQGADGGIGRDC